MPTSPIVSKYQTLLRLLAAGQISAIEFQEIFLPLFKYEHTQPSKEVQSLLLDLFRAVDDFNPSPSRNSDEIDETALKSFASSAAKELANYSE